MRSHRDRRGTKPEARTPVRPEGYGGVTRGALLPGIFSGPAYRSIAAPSSWRDAAVTRAIRLLPRAARVDLPQEFPSSEKR